ncbi:MAG: hypothetical protein AAGC65_22625 [Mucilaginibacter sp.]|uniref:hypothetical protein n=1 Tax=Mucilaginibacter sp. TaxID=1882438 RepID=UPI0031A76248
MKYLILSVLIIFCEILTSRAQKLIPASLASQYIGQFKNVYGYDYESKIVRIKGQKDSFQELVYLSDSTLKKCQFIIIITEKADPNLRGSKEFSHEELLKDKMRHRSQANGKIILFKGKPAIVVDDPENYLFFLKFD